MKDSWSYDAKWLRLDNAAKIYPVVATVKNSGVFRIAARLQAVIDPVRLQQAVWDCTVRFPAFYVKLREGIFWFYYEPNTQPAIIRKESPYICEAINQHRNNNYLFTFFYYENRISLEVFHSLFDGTGAFALLKAVIYRYLELMGHKLENDGSILSITDRPTWQESEDSYNALFTDKAREKLNNRRAYRITGERFKNPLGLGIITATLETEALKRLCKTNNATVSEYLVSLLNYSVIHTGNKKAMMKHPIRISVPVNMRKFLYSQSIRNFSLYFNTCIKYQGEDWDFETVLKNVQSQFKTELTLERLQQRLNQNVRFEKNVIIKIMPLILKKILFKIGYAFIGHLPTTMSVTNFGEIKLPESMGAYVESFEFNLASGKKPGLAVNSYNGKTRLIFNRCFVSTEIERTFLSFLSEKGLKVIIETNNWR